MTALFASPKPPPLCPACKGFPPRHDECQGGAVLCECLVEVMIEAEETDGREDR